MAGLVPAIHVFVRNAKKDVDARDKPGHDGSVSTSLRGALATKQSMEQQGRKMDCFAALAMTVSKHREPLVLQIRHQH
jgi:hypothetical protein